MAIRRYKVTYLMSYNERFTGVEKRKWRLYSTRVKAMNKREAKRKLRNGRNVVLFAREVTQ